MASLLVTEDVPDIGTKEKDRTTIIVNKNDEYIVDNNLERNMRIVWQSLLLMGLVVYCVRLLQQNLSTATTKNRDCFLNSFVWIQETIWSTDTCLLWKVNKECCLERINVFLAPGENLSYRKVIHQLMLTRHSLIQGKKELEDANFRRRERSAFMWGIRGSEIKDIEVIFRHKTMMTFLVKMSLRMSLLTLILLRHPRALEQIQEDVLKDVVIAFKVENLFRSEESFDR